MRSQNLQILPAHLAITYLTGNACAGNVYIVPKYTAKLTVFGSKQSSCQSEKRNIFLDTLDKSIPVMYWQVGYLAQKNIKLCNKFLVVA